MQDNDWNGFKEKMGKRNVRTDIDHAQKEEMGQSPEGWCGFVCVCVWEREREWGLNCLLMSSLPSPPWLLPLFVPDLKLLVTFLLLLSVDCWDESIREWVLLHKRGENCALMARVGEGVGWDTEVEELACVTRIDGAPSQLRKAVVNKGTTQWISKCRSSDHYPSPSEIQEVRFGAWSLRRGDGQRG